MSDIQYSASVLTPGISSLAATKIRMERSSIKLVLLLSAFVIGISAEPDLSKCTQQTVDYCIKDLAEFDAEINEAVVPTLEESVAREHCRLYNEFSDCMSDAIDDCSHSDQRYLEGVNSAYDYWCRRTFDEYLDHQECLADKELHVEGQHCQNTMNEKKKLLDNHPDADDAEFVISKFCYYVRDYVDCVENAVMHHCGPEAGKWQRGLDERLLQPTMEDYGCVKNGKWVIDGAPYPDVPDPATHTGASKTLVGILVAVAIIIILLAVVGLIVFVMMRKKDRRPRSSRGDTVESPPPPYVVYDPATGGATGYVNGVPQAGPVPEKQARPPSYAENPANGSDRTEPVHITTGPTAPPTLAETEASNHAYENPTYVPNGDNNNYQRF